MGRGVIGANMDQGALAFKLWIGYKNHALVVGISEIFQ